MKKFLFFFWLAMPCLLSAQLQAELITEADSIVTLEYAFEELDLSSLSTGRLLDKSFQLRDPKPYDGVTLSDQNFASMLNFSLLFATMYNSAVSADDLLPAPDEYVDATLAIEENGIIPIAAMTYDYHHLKEYAVDNNLISFYNDQFHEIPNPPESPYQIATMFVATPLKNFFYSPEITFSLPVSLYYSESTVGVTNIEIDFGDGNGFQSFNFGDEITVNYGGLGKNKIIFKYHYADGSMQQGHSQIVIEEDPSLNLLSTDNRYSPANSPNLTQTFTITESNGDDLTMTARVYTVCEDEVVTKPFIYIEGFNPEQFDDLTPANMFFKLQSEAPFGATILDHLENEGYDIIHVDIGNSLAAIQENAAVFEMVVDWVNGLKAESGSTEKNMVMGESMGGVIAKYSLLTMEQNGLDHEVEHFISFDSPLRGANVPVSFQMMFTHVAYMDILPFPLNLFGFLPLKNFVPPLKGFDTVLRGTAPRQMLYHYVGDVRPQMNRTSLHEDFYAELAALGTSDIFTHTALFNGSQTGELVDGLSPGGKLVNIHANVVTGTIDILGDLNDLEWWLIPALQIAVAGSFAITKTKAMPEKNAPPEVIYDGVIKVLVPAIGLALPTSYEVLEAGGNNPYDSAPGGLYGIDLEDVNAFDLSATFHSRYFTFVPTVSALDISSPENEDVLFDVSDEATVIDNGNTLVERYIASPDATFQSFGVNQHNQEHVEFTPLNSRFLPLRYATSSPVANLSAFIAIPSSITINSNTIPINTFNYGEISATSIIQHLP